MSDTKKDMAGYVNLDYVVKTVMMDLNENSMHNYEKYLRLAARGFTDLNIYTLGQIKVAYLPIAENFTANLPNDLVMYTKIGINVGGRIWTLTYNPDLVLPRKLDDCGKTISEIKSCGDVDDIYSRYGGAFYFASHYRNGQYVGELYGIGGGMNEAYYKIDWERRQIALSNEIGGYDELIIEYKSNGVAADGSTVVPRQAVQALVEYVHWKRVEYDASMPESKVNRRQLAYEREYDKLQFFENAMTIDEYLDHTYKHYQSTPRR